MYSMQRSYSSQYNNKTSNNRFNTNNNNGYLQRSSSTNNCTIHNKSGFKPSDKKDPSKREFLANLSKKILHLVSFYSINIFFYISYTQKKIINNLFFYTCCRFIFILERFLWTFYGIFYIKHVFGFWMFIFRY